MKTPPPIKKKESDSTVYYVHVNDEQMGPYDFEKIKVLLEFKNIDENTLIWKEGMEDWEIISTLEEFKKQIIIPNSEKKSTKEKESVKQKEPIAIKTNAVKIDYTKLFNALSVLTLVASFLALIGAVHQYFQFQNNREIDLSYIMSFSAWGGLISVLLSLISSIYLFRKKTNFIKGLISLLVGISAIIILYYTESEYRSYWRPFWDNEMILCGRLDENKLNEIQEGWRTGQIDIDSLRFYLKD